MLKTLLKSYVLVCLILTCGSVFGEEAKKEVPTEGKFAKELHESVTSQLTFSELKNSIQILAKSKGALPLEFIPNKGLEKSDGILSLGDSFTWPGCGIDRTRYTIKEITQEFVVIAYTRGIPRQDGYQDIGEFRVSYGNQQEVEQAGADDAEAAVR